MQAEATAADDDLQSLMQWHVVFQDDDGEGATAAASTPAGAEEGMRRLSACARSFVRVVSHSVKKRYEKGVRRGPALKKKLASATAPRANKM